MASGGGDEVRERVSNVWSYLDQLAENNPEEYKRFIEKAMKERKEFMEPPRPVFCLSTGIRGKTGQKLYVNVCQWNRVPVRHTEREEIIPVKGGVIRHLIEDGKRIPNCLLVDVAFSPLFIHSCRQEGKMIEAFLELTLDYVDEYLSILTDRRVDIVPDVRFKGPEEDIFHSLDHETQKKVSQESQMDLGETLISSLKKEKKTKTNNHKKKRENRLPPLFPQQQSNHGNGLQETHKLIEEVSALAAKNGKIPNHNLKKKNGGGKNGRKKSSQKQTNERSKTSITTHKEEQSQTDNDKESENGCGQLESGRSQEESGWSLGESEPGKTMPENKVTIIGGEGEGGRDLVLVRTRLVEIDSVELIDLEASDEDIKVKAAEVYDFTIRFPIKVHPNLASASFNKRSRTLMVKLSALDPELEKQ